MVVRELLDELSAVEKALRAVLKRMPDIGQDMRAYMDIHRKVESVVRRTTRTKLRIKACCEPSPVAARYLPKPLVIARRAA